jgi:hypothetical protein
MADSWRIHDARGEYRFRLIYDLRNGHTGGVRVGFININDMYNNDVGKGGICDHEAYEAKKNLLCEHIAPTSLLYISILLTYTYIHTYIHTDIHTHIHTHIHT